MSTPDRRLVVPDPAMLGLPDRDSQLAERVTAVEEQLAQPAQSGSDERVDYVSFPGDQQVAAGTAKMIFPTARTLLGITPTLGVGGEASADVIVDANRNGDASIFTTQANRPRVPAGSGEGAEAAPDVTALAAGDYLTFDRDQVGGPTAPSFVANSAASFSTSTTRALPRPAATQTDDVHLVGLMIVYPDASGTPTVTPPAGFTQIGTPASAGVDSDGLNVWEFTYWKRDDGTAGPFTFTIGAAPAGFGWMGSLLTYRGCIATGSPVDATSVGANDFTTDVPAPSLDATQANDTLVLFVPMDAGTNVTADGFTQRSAGGGNPWAGDMVQAAPGASGVKTAVLSSATYAVARLIALKADASAVLPGTDLTLAVRHKAA